MGMPSRCTAVSCSGSPLSSHVAQQGAVKQRLVIVGVSWARDWGQRCDSPTLSVQLSHRARRFARVIGRVVSVRWPWVCLELAAIATLDGVRDGLVLVLVGRLDLRSTQCKISEGHVCHCCRSCTAVMDIAFMAPSGTDRVHRRTRGGWNSAAWEHHLTRQR